MKTLFGIVAAGGLLLTSASPSQAQVNVQLGRNGSPVVSFGQPSYAQPGYTYGQQGYTYAQPRYTQQRGYTYAQPRYSQRGYTYGQPRYTQQPGTTYYSSGYSGYTAPSRAYRQPPTTGYASPSYGQPSYNGYAQPVQGTGVIINGRPYVLPR